MYDVAILGGGPAGLAATMYCLRKGMDVQLIAGSMGGKAAWSFTVPDMNEYQLIKAREQVQIFRGHIEYLSHTWRDDTARTVGDTGSSFEIALAGGAMVKAARLIVATGVKPQLLGVPGEKEFMGRALGTSALSYTHLLRDRTIVVAGNSNRALEAAMEAAQQAETVHLVLEPGATHSSTHLSLVEQQDNVTVHLEATIRQINGESFAQSITIEKGVRVGSAQTPATTIEADAFFLEHEPHYNSAMVAHLVDTTASGAIQINERNETNHPRIFAAGDVTTVGVEQVLIALGEGARAGLSAYRHLTLQEDQR